MNDHEKSGALTDDRASAPLEVGIGPFAQGVAPSAQQNDPHQDFEGNPANAHEARCALFFGHDEDVHARKSAGDNKNGVQILCLAVTSTCPNQSHFVSAHFRITDEDRIGTGFVQVNGDGFADIIAGARAEPAIEASEKIRFNKAEAKSAVEAPANHIGTHTRITARVRAEMRDALEQAAQPQGATLNQFVVYSAYQETQRILERETVIRLSQRDAQKVF